MTGFKMKVTPEIENLTEVCKEHSSLDLSLYQKYDVKRGLRDINGKGVLAGLTQISNVCATKVVDGKEVGFALFFHNFSTFLGRAGLYLEDLFVLPEYRGKGYGKAILKKLAEIAVERKCGRLEWSCLDWNKPSIDFYLSLDAEPMSDWTVYRLTGDRLKKLAQ